MTQIDTTLIEKDKTFDEREYLDLIGFITRDKNKIKIITDEEGNDEIVLSPDAARYVATELMKVADEIERDSSY